MTEISLAVANQLIHSVLVKAAEMKLPPLGVAVVDAGAHLRALQCQDNLTFLRARICQAKAWTAIAMGVDTAEIAARFDLNDRQKGFIGALNAMTDGQIIALPGGILLRNAERKIVGALGVAGAASEEDETCALFAAETIGLRPS